MFEGKVEEIGVAQSGIVEFAGLAIRCGHCRHREGLGIAISSTGANAGKVYVTNNASGTVSVISGGSVTGTISVGGGPSAVAVAPVGNANAGYVYVTNYNDGTVSVINPSGTVVATLTVGANPIGVAVSSGGVVYVANSGSNTVSVITG